MKTRELLKILKYENKFFSTYGKFHDFSFSGLASTHYAGGFITLSVSPVVYGSSPVIYTLVKKNFILGAEDIFELEDTFDQEGNLVRSVLYKSQNTTYSESEPWFKKSLKKIMGMS